MVWTREQRTPSDALDPEDRARRHDSLSAAQKDVRAGRLRAGNACVDVLRSAAR